jgi:hypothetical protein
MQVVKLNFVSAGRMPALPDSVRATPYKDVNTDLSPLASGGAGMHSIQERVELIRPFCPAQVKIESVPGKGSQLILELSRSKGAGA